MRPHSDCVGSTSKCAATRQACVQASRHAFSAQKGYAVNSRCTVLQTSVSSSLGRCCCKAGARPNSSALPYRPRSVRMCCHGVIMHRKIANMPYLWKRLWAYETEHSHVEAGLVTGRSSLGFRKSVVPIKAQRCTQAFSVLGCVEPVSHGHACSPFGLHMTMSHP